MGFFLNIYILNRSKKDTIEDSQVETVEEIDTEIDTEEMQESLKISKFKYFQLYDIKGRRTVRRDFILKLIRKFPPPPVEYRSNAPRRTTSFKN